MAFDFAALKKKAAELVESGKDKAKELTEIGKLKTQNAEEQSNIRKAYIELGKLCYAEYGNDTEGPFAELCSKINDSKAKIAYNNERIEDIRAAGNIAEEDLPVEEEVPAEDAPAEETPEE